MIRKRTAIAALALVLGFLLCGCGTPEGLGQPASPPEPPAGFAPDGGAFPGGPGMSDPAGETPDLSGTELFTDRDLVQNPERSAAETLTVRDGETLRIAGEGVYLLQGSAKNATVLVEAEKSAKIQLLLDGLRIENEESPCIDVRSADKVYVTTVSDSSLAVTGSFDSDGKIGTDGTIFSRDDLVLNGTAKLSIRSPDNGVVCKDDLKITGGSYDITAASKCIEAKDSIRVCGGSFSLTAGSDGIHAENDKDDTLGWICITGGDFHIDARDDSIHAKAFLQIDGGSFRIAAKEGLESTFVRINDGELSIESRDDGINAGRKSSYYAVCVEINGGSLTISMAAGDTDGIDSNGSIVINGGYVEITGSSGFDYESSGELNGGTVILNGEKLDSLPNQMIGGPGGPGGGPGGPGRPGKQG